MQPEQWRRIEEIYLAAREVPVGDRPALLAERCGADPALRAEVEALLDANRRSRGFLDTPALEVVEDGDHRVTEPASSNPVTLGQYRVESEIGRGGMGVVYRAVDTVLGRSVALKVLPESVADDPGRLAHIALEARLLASLNHPNLTTVHALEEAAGCRFFAMELIEGETLQSKLERGPIPVTVCLELFRQIALGLEVSHGAGVVHCDLKPANIRITPEGRAKILDFGLARLVATRTTESSIPSISGTPGYMSPEQWRAQDVGPRTDIWAFGCLLYECLTGRLAFDGVDTEEIRSRTLNDPPDWTPFESGPRLRELVESCLAKNSVDRCESMSTVREAIERELATENTTASPNAASTVPNNLPVNLTEFVGRNRERAELIGLVGANSVTTITGAGGCGKSRLSIEVARDGIQDFPGGVWLVELSAITDAADIASAVARSLGLRKPNDVDWVDRIGAQLGQRRSLLLLDNCERLVEGCSRLIEGLLSHAPDLRVLATSREPLRLAGEQVYGLPTLDLPPEDADRLEVIERSDAGRLFLSRARGGTRRSALIDDDAAGIATICRRLDGLPLGLELAAARTAHLSVPEIATRLNDRFQLLTSNVGARLDHHTTLRALIDWSHEQLDEDERVLLRRLAIFAGGFTLEAAESVCSFDGLEPVRVLDLVGRLVDRSLVELAADRNGPTVTSRYWLLESVHEYAREQLAHSVDGPTLRRRHGQYYLAQAERFALVPTSEHTPEWVRRFEREMDNYRRALDDTSADPDHTRLRLAVALRRLWIIRGHWTEVRRYYDLDPRSEVPSELRFRAMCGLAECLGLVGEYDESEELACAVLAADEDECPPDVRMDAYIRRAVCLFGRSDYDDLMEFADSALDLARAHGDPEKLIEVLQFKSLAHRGQGRFRKAQAIHDEVVEIARESGVRMGGEFLNLRGIIDFNLGQLDSAAELFEESIAAFRKLGDLYQLANSMHFLAAILRNQNRDLARAEKLTVESLEIRRRLGSHNTVIRSLYSLAHLSIGRSQYSRAVDLCLEGAALARRIGTKRGLAICLNLLVGLLRRVGRYEESNAICQEVLQLADEMNADDVWAAIAPQIAEAEILSGNLDEANRLAEQVLALGFRDETIWMIVSGLTTRAHVHLVREEWQNAHDSLTDAIERCERTGFHRDQGELLMMDGVAQFRLGRVETAWSRLEASFALRASGSNDFLVASSLAGMSWAAAESSHFEYAARVIGLADHLLDRSGSHLLRYDVRLAAIAREKAQAALGAERFDALVIEGRQLDIARVRRPLSPG